MFKVKMINHISPACRDILNEKNYKLSEDEKSPEAIFVRASNLQELKFNPELLCIARAGVGINNVPVERCTEAGIVVFNTPGGNANGVKELFLFGLTVASRDIMGGVRWVSTYKDEKVPVQTAMEQIKKRYAGPEYIGKTLGIIGMGAVGSRVANTALGLGMNVIGYDPFLSVDAAWSVSRHVERVDTLDAILKSSDYITLHVPLKEDTRSMIDEAAIAKMKNGVHIINYARGEVVDEDAIINALESGKIIRYVTDFPTARLVANENVIATPHLGGTTVESEQNCALMAAKQMDDYLRNGNIKNSVNLPDMVSERVGSARVCVIHANLPGRLTALLNVFAKEGINIENMMNRSNGSVAYSVFDMNTSVTDKQVAELMEIDGICRVRVV